MNLYTFFNTFIAAVAADSTLDDWANSMFGTGIKVLADLVSDDLPAAADMPYIIFHTPEVSKHQERRANEYVMGVDLALDKDALKIRAEGSITEPAGIELILDFVEKIIDIIAASLPANTVFGYRLAADTLGSLPEVHGYMDLEFSEKITIGTDPMD